MNQAFANLHDRARRGWQTFENDPRPRILVGTATCGRSAGAMEAWEAFRQTSEARGIDTLLVEVGCIGLCYAEPVVVIAKPGRPAVCYGEVTAKRAAELIERCLAGDNPAAEHALGVVGEVGVDGIPPLFDTPVLKPQVRRTLRRCGWIDPADIEHYLAHDGYAGLAHALEIGPAAVVEQLRAAGLRGRGGAGFPTWRKWRSACEVENPHKYVIVNGSEGDPGVFSNRLLLESDPHAVLEGMLIAAFAVGAEEGYIYCPAEYPLVLERVRTALGQMEQCGLLGNDILSSSFSFRVSVKEGAGAYICGEEGALIECIEGKRGIPRLRPPFPPVSGLWECPTIVHNVETLACVAEILHCGASCFAQAGTANSKGTKLLCLSGNVCRGGVFEVPFGTTLRETIWSIGGGAADQRAVKAVQIGGPAGGCLTPEHGDLPLDQDSLLPYGASLGSGGLIVLDESICMIDLARNMLHFSAPESCGQCAPCRLGTRQMVEIVEDVAGGRATRACLELLAELGRGLEGAAACGLGQGAARPLLATLRYFQDEYEAHLAGRCPAGVCRAGAQSPCQATT